MPQKPLKASGGKVQKAGKKQQQAANRHGKTPQMRKGESFGASSSSSSPSPADAGRRSPPASASAK
jgi:hypothetical protein